MPNIENMLSDRLKHFINVYAIPFLSTAFALLLMYDAYTLFIGRPRFTLFFILFALVTTSLRFVGAANSSLFRIIRGGWLLIFGLLLVALSLVPILYLSIEYNAIAWRTGDNTTVDFLMAFLLLIPILLMTWKKGGAVLIILVLVSICYMFFGSAFAGFFKHGGFTLDDFLTVQILSLSDSGLLCSATQIVATWVAMFVIYAGIVQGYGIFDFVFRLASAICKNRLYLVPQIPVIASLFFGSISGSAAANVGATGSFTIPLMKAYKIPPQLAGGIEAVASTGGQIMPPVMGVTAFLLAMMMGVSYFEVMLHGFIPAVLFYVIFAFGVHQATTVHIQFSSGGDGSSEFFIEKDNRIRKKDILILVPLTISVAVILVTMIYYRMEVMQAGLYGILSFLMTQVVYEFCLLRRPGWFMSFIRKFVRGATIGGSTAANIGVMIAGMALILKALTATALAPKISYIMVDVAGNSLFGLLTLVWAICVIFGMAVSTLIVYLLVVVIAAPAFETLGIPPMVSHFTIFYFGVISFITPPMAPASLIASGIAGATFMKTSFQAVRVGIALFFLPFTFIAFPELIEFSSETLLAMFLVGVGFMTISYCLNCPSRQMKYVIRLVYLIAGIFICFHPFFYPQSRPLAYLVAVCIIFIFGKNFIGQRLRALRRSTAGCHPTEAPPAEREASESP